MPGLGLSLFVSFKVKSSILEEKVSWYGEKSADLQQKKNRNRGQNDVLYNDFYYTCPVKHCILQQTFSISVSIVTRMYNDSLLIR